MKKVKSLSVVVFILVLVAAFASDTMANTKTKTSGSKTSAKSKAAKPSPSKSAEDQIHVSADALVSDRTANYAEFQGNVVTTQKGSVMHSDRLKIFYAQDPKKGSKDPKSQGSIDKIIATGHVKIEMEDKTAWADKAVYTKTDDSILLSGGNPRIFSGKSYLSGETIRVNRKTEEVFVNAGPGAKPSGDKPKQRVEMNIFTNDPGLK